MKTISKSAARSKTVANIVASLRIEQLTPSAQVVQGLQSCLAGDSTTGQVLANVIQQHVQVRRN